MANTKLTLNAGEISTLEISLISAEKVLDNLVRTVTLIAGADRMLAHLTDAASSLSSATRAIADIQTTPAS